jgi:hypothetical protein
MQCETESSLNEEKKGRFISMESIIFLEMRCHRDFEMVLDEDLSLV